MKTTQNLANDLVAGTVWPTLPIHSAADPAGQLDTQISLSTDMVERALNQFKTPQCTHRVPKDKHDPCPSPNASAARTQFLAKHGPQAELPRGTQVPKELRKAQLAAEMELWKGF